MSVDIGPYYRTLRSIAQFVFPSRGGAVNWEQAFNFNPTPGDDGWFIDDVTVETEAEGGSCDGVARNQPAS